MAHASVAQRTTAQKREKSSNENKIDGTVLVDDSGRNVRFAGDSLCGQDRREKGLTKRYRAPHLGKGVHVKIDLNKSSETI